MATISPFSVSLVKNAASEKQQKYLDDLLSQAVAELESLSEHAPQSCEYVSVKWREMLATQNTWFADTLISTLKDHDWLMEVYRVAERTLRNKNEKDALKPLVAEKMGRQASQ